MAVQIWDIKPILMAAANAAYAAATSNKGAEQWETESKTRMNHWLKNHSLNNYRRKDIRRPLSQPELGGAMDKAACIPRRYGPNLARDQQLRAVSEVTASRCGLPP